MFVGAKLRYVRVFSIIKRDMIRSEASFFCMNFMLQVHQHRWAIFVRGMLVSSTQPCNVRLEETVFLADQIATKISPTSYHVELKGTEIVLNGDNNEATRADDDERGNILQAVAAMLA